MSAVHVTHCSAEQLRVLNRNSWKYAQVKGKHIRIHPGNSDVPVTPPGPVNYTAAIEVLDKEDKTRGEADAEAQKVVESLFATLL
jgi:hypothetical protein